MRESFHPIDAQLREAPAFQALAEVQRRQVATDLAVIAGFLAPPPGPPRAGKGALSRKSGPTSGVTRAVEMPAFVRALLAGTFQAVVDASVEQMKSYAELVAEVARSLDELRPDADARTEVAAGLERSLRVIFPGEREPDRPEPDAPGPSEES